MTVPPLLIVATLGSLELHVPPAVVSDSAKVEPIQIEGELEEADAGFFGDDLDALHDTRHDLVLDG